MADVLRRRRLSIGDSYRALGDKVDGFFDRVRSRYPDALRCGRGCSQCCEQHLTLLPLEMARVAAAAAALPAAERAAVQARVSAGKAGDPRCPLLDDAGACRVYEARPIICRSHGAPLKVDGRRDVCPLNFTGETLLEDVDVDCLLDLDRLNGMLVLINELTVGDAGRVDLFDGLAVALTG